jgi:hypothetical protein
MNTKLLSFKDHLRQFGQLIWRYGWIYLLISLALSLVFSLKSKIFTLWLSGPLNDSGIYPDFSSWVVIGLSLLISFLLLFLLFSLTMGLVNFLKIENKGKISFKKLFYFKRENFKNNFLLFIGYIILLSFSFSIVPVFFKLFPLFILYLESNSLINSAPLGSAIVWAPVLLLGIVFFVIIIKHLLLLFTLDSPDKKLVIKSANLLISGNFWKITLRLFLLLLGARIILVIFLTSLEKFSPIINEVGLFFGLFLLIFFLAPIYLDRTKNVGSDGASGKSSYFYKIGKIILIALVGLIALGIGLYNILSLLEGAIKDSVLDNRAVFAEVVAIPKEKNAYYFLFKEYEESLDKYLGLMKEWDKGIGKGHIVKASAAIEDGVWDESLRSDLESGSGYLKRYDEVMDKFNFFQDPSCLLECSVANLERTPVPYSMLRASSRFASLRILDLNRKKQVDQALNEILKQNKFGQMITIDSGTTIEFLVAVSVKLNNWRVANQIIAQNDLSAVDLKKFKEDLGGANNSENYFPNYLNMEYCGYKVAVKEIKDMGKKGYYILPDACQNDNSDAMRLIIKAFLADSYPKFKELFPQKEMVKKITPLWLIEKNVVCHFMFSLPVSTYYSTARKYFSEKTFAVLTDLNLEIKAHKKTNGAWPKELSELNLAGKYVDPFSGQNLYYDAQKTLLWSVGVDGINNNGSGDDTVLDLKTGLFSGSY